MNRLIEYTVFSGFVTACRFATWPTSRSPVFVMATTDGVVRAPSWLGITTGSPPCITATTEFVVPRSIPIILLIAAIPPETCFTFLAPCLAASKANTVEILYSEANSSATIQVERDFVKFSYGDCKPFIFFTLQRSTFPLDTRHEVFLDL